MGFISFLFFCYLLVRNFFFNFYFISGIKIDVVRLIEIFFLIGYIVSSIVLFLINKVGYIIRRVRL